MSDLLDEPQDNAPVWSVSEIAGAVRRVVEGAFEHVRVRGEIGRVSRPRSGHLYLDLKDDKSVLNAVVWKGVAARLGTAPEEGMEVIATGRLTTFGAQSRYQLIVETLEPAGVGALMAMLEKRKAALAAEGLFAAERKRAIPYLPETIGVVTSASGAVIRDILHRLAERFPRPVYVWPAAVQGAKCAPEVAAAIRGFDALAQDGPVPRPDVLIVARGGGSVEDLWGFNEEDVVRAVAACRIPLISAVGHETDVTLIDHVADRRAPTPTAAAEIAAPVRAELTARLAGLEERRLRALWRGFEDRRRTLRDLARALVRPDEILSERRQRLDGLGERLPAALREVAHRRRRAFIDLARKVEPAVMRETLGLYRERLGRRDPAGAAGRRLAESRRDLAVLARGLSARALRRGIADDRARLRALAARLGRAGAEPPRAARARFEAGWRMLESLNYRRVLGRGFALVRQDRALVTSAAEIRSGAALRIELHDGEIGATADGTGKPRSTRRKSGDDGQGALDL